MVQAILHQISIWIILLPFAIGVINYRKFGTDSRWVFLLVIGALFPQLATAFLKNDGGYFNLLYNFYTPFEFAILFQIFSPKLNQRFAQKAMFISAFIYIGCAAGFLIRFGFFDKFLGGLVCVNNVFYMVWIFMFLLKEYQSEDTIITLNNPFAWYLTAFAFYGPCTVVTMALYQYIRHPDNTLLMSLGVIQDVFNIMLYGFISIGLFLERVGVKSVS